MAEQVHATPSVMSSWVTGSRLEMCVGVLLLFLITSIGRERPMTTCFQRKLQRYPQPLNLIIHQLKGPEITIYPTKKCLQILTKVKKGFKDLFLP